MSNNFAVARYNTDGSLDTTFGDGGIAMTDFLHNTADIATGVAIAPDRKIVAAGWTNLGDYPTDTFALARYLGALSPHDALGNLLLAVSGLAQSGVLNDGQSRALAATLNTAARQLDADNVPAAAGALDAFVNKINALISGGTLSVSQGDMLIARANEILSQI